MKERINVAQLAPEAYRAMLGLEKFLAGSGLPHITKELVKLRVSQINGCAFCVDMHSHDLKQAGESDERLFAVAVWRETPFFTDAERAALALAERPPDSPTAGRPYPTTSGTRPRRTTSRRRWPRWWSRSRRSTRGTG